MEWVGQKHANGCGPAVLAMLLDEPYDDIIAEINSEDWHGHDGDWKNHGITHISLDRLLIERGYFIARKYDWGGKWPPELWADLHFASIKQPSGRGHFVAVDEKGVLDPLKEGYFSLKDYEVQNFVGVRNPL